MADLWREHELVQDVEREVGKDSLQSIIENAETAWPEPQPLTEKIESLPYPVDELSATIREAVEEVHGFVQAPLVMVVNSALVALSVASQAHIDIKRANKLQGPVSLFMLTIADSGERKSTCDGFFSTAIQEYENQQREEMKPELERYEVERDSWDAERSGLLAAIKEAGKGKRKDDRTVESLRNDMYLHEENKPVKPRVPRLLLGDETPENLAWGMAQDWPSAGIVSSEAGVVLGSHGMGKGSAMRNLALLNVLWDGGEHKVGRRGSESFVVKDARLTMGLQTQEATLKEFIESSRDLARGTGFFARFLISRPDSTQGERKFNEAPDHWPKLATYSRRLTEILNKPAPINEDGTLSPALMILTPEAKKAWVGFHDQVEAQLGIGGELCDVRDVASKIADNAVRLAALFQFFEGGAEEVSISAFNSAACISLWHLNESKRYFGEIALPAEMAGAVRLNDWLIKYCQKEQAQSVSTRDAQQLGPLRKKEKLSSALDELEDLDRVRVVEEGKKRIVLINPALIDIAKG